LWRWEEGEEGKGGRNPAEPFNEKGLGELIIGTLKTVETKDV